MDQSPPTRGSIVKVLETLGNVPLDTKERTTRVKEKHIYAASDLGRTMIDKYVRGGMPGVIPALIVPPARYSDITI